LRTPGFLVSFRSGDGRSKPRCSNGSRISDRVIRRLPDDEVADADAGTRVFAAIDREFSTARSRLPRSA
jgi:hypothetical protein